MKIIVAIILLACIASSCSKEQVIPEEDSPYYFRIVSEDEDGTVQYSKVVSIL